MSENQINEAFTNAYNNFDSRPLVGETLRKFYIDDFTKDAVKSIKTTITISKKYRKMLVIGHRGCGKSTILNKVSEELKNDFYLVSFSAADTLNMNDVETIDILISIYLQLLNSMNERDINVPIQRFNDVMKSVKQKLNLTEVGVTLLKILTFKIKVENESRATLREEFRNQIEILDNSISDCIESIDEHYKTNNNPGKDVLIIIDDLDKLLPEFAEKIFFKDSHLLTMPKAKIIYTFPLETYYCEAFNTYVDRYEDQFISLVVVDQNKNGDIGIQQLEKLVLKRISEQYIEEEALKEMILSSGGLLRDLIKFMQDACKEAIVSESMIIDQNIAEKVINKTANQYKRLFDFPNYREYIEKIADKSQRDEIENIKLIYLLKYLFILEYRFEDDLWYDVHPCLKKVLNGELK
ncbi:P-loop NTPase fold protein [Crocosphaera sp. XPORK-15E]|uniref:P-loop NTPase fold protein n=1 Tax=Crocosphaera sp. XPORK-15E TaxID=3110247 RepID=UPI002B211143|nr:P-loop NTPase fold protein [Crocosphaera sp. XPORK-15E]MEA5536222.1 P-loop NTPase fold protein [Crocosphaera sp. XPORK-15E]